MSSSWTWGSPYPPWQVGGRWRAVWHEDGERQQCESVSQDKLAAKLDKVRQRLSAGAANMTRPGADLIAWYLNPDRLPAERRWSRRHAGTQRRLCQRYAVPVIGAVACQDITAVHAQKIVNAAPTASEGNRVHRMLSALVGAGVKGGYLVNPQYGENGVTVLLEPGTIDGLACTSSMVILHAARHRLPVPRLARAMPAPGIAASLAVNVARAGPTAWPARQRQPGPRSRWLDHMNCSPGWSGPRPEADRERTTAYQRRTSRGPSGSPRFSRRARP